MGENPHPPVRSVWRCPCGYTNKWLSVASHRRGKKTRPECNGPLVKIAEDCEGMELPYIANHPIREEDTERFIANHDDGDPDHGPGPSPGSEEPIGDPVDVDTSGLLLDPEPVDELAVDDAEDIARRLNEQKQKLLDDAYLVPDYEGIGGGEGYQVTEGDFHLEQPLQATGVSQARETVLLPVFVRVMYDWAKGQGWSRGDGSLSAFVADCLLDHFTNRWRKAVAVVSLDEVTSANDGTSERGYLQAGNGKNPGAKRPARA